LPSENKLAAAEPANTGRYCNVHWSDGSWGFNWTGSAPCSTLLRSKTGGTVVRAGLYSTTGANHVFVRCSNGGYGPLGASGTAPLAAAYNAVGKTTNRCIFQVSAGALPVFDKMFKSAHQLPYPGREALGFMHGLTPVPLEQFQNNQSGMGVVDRFGKQISDTREYAYDNPLNEGRPLYAPADGIVLMDGSRERDVTRFGNEGTPNQGEIYLKVGIGPSATYRETFIVYYAHVRRRMVADGQSVRRGQILGYVGATGATSGFAHLHTGVFRASNINARGTTPQFGYHVNFVPDDDDTGNNMGNWNAIDPLGWANGHAFDPWAYLEWDTAAGFPQAFTGLGGWSVNLFKPGQAFRYP
jgi:murein DD-endopeptidase MepM/ murein hydrolase activator NlpD